jgi:class 3 adenylate cyclase/tetratricopeptide (TPR) repeat protein
MQCPVCQHQNTPAARFCSNCGTRLPLSCPNCGQAVAPQDRFCSNCGFALTPQPATLPGPTALAGAPSAVSVPADDASAAAAAAPAVRDPSPSIPDAVRAKIESARASRAMVGERRVVTVLFCDLEGSTALAEQLDPEEWTEIMNGAFAHLIAPVYRYEGTVAHLLGDAVLAFFGAPIAHEDDPRRAVLAGLEMVEAFETYRAQVRAERGLEVNVRVGINTGLVVVGEIGSDLRLEYSALGDAVNVAARMQQLAAPGTVQIAESTYRLVRPLFEFEPLGGVNAKGKAEPVPAYRVVRPIPGAELVRGIEGLHSELVGRAAELAKLRATIEELVAGQGGIVGVLGEAGLGKSRLVRELQRELTTTKLLADGAESARRGQLRWLQGRSLSYTTSMPYRPFRQMVRAALGVPAEGALPYEQLTRSLAVLLPERADDTAPVLATLLDVEIPPEPAERVRFLEPGQLRQRINEALVDLVTALARERPTVLELEDLHWADQSSIDLLERLLPLATTEPLVVLAVFRPQHDEPSWRFHETASRVYPHRYTQIRLGPLDSGQAQQLIANLLHVENLPRSLRAQMLQKAEGNPFYLEEVIRSLLDAGVIVQSNGNWVATREIERVPIPETLSGVIMARLDRLDDGTRAVAQSASVVGRQFDYEVIEEVHGASEEFPDAVMTLEQKELIRDVSEPPRLSYSFKHGLTRETAYGSMLQRRRREVHARVAECLQRIAPDRVAEIAWHFIQADELARALPYSVEAGDRAFRSYAMPEVLTWYGRALDAVPAAHDHALARRAYEGMGRALEITNDFQKALENYTAMLAYGEEHEDVLTQVSAHNKIANLLAFQFWEFPEAEQHLDQAERLARAHDDLSGMVEMATVRCLMCVPQAEFDQAFETLGDSVSLARDHNLAQPLAQSLVHSATTLMYMGKFEQMIEVAEEARRVSEEVNDLPLYAELLAQQLPNYHIRNGDLVEARRLATEGMSIAIRVGADYPAAHAALTHATLDWLVGAYESGLGRCNQVLQLSQDLGMFQPMFASIVYSLMEAMALDLGPRVFQKLSERFNGPLDEMEEMGGSLVWANRGFSALGLGNIDRAEKLFERGLTVPHMTWVIQKPRHLVGMAFVSLGRGDIARAAELVTEARTVAEDQQMKPFYPLVDMAEAQVWMAQGAPDQALEAYSQARDVAAEVGLRPALWQILAGIAGIHAAQGRSDEAGRALKQAREVVIQIAKGMRNETVRRSFLEYVNDRVKGG